jgi:hypothetical protein
MYVLVEDGGQIFAFGSTPEQARDDFTRRQIWYDGPRLRIRRCSPALYRWLEANAELGVSAMRCRINNDGLAVSLKRRFKAGTPRRKSGTLRS